MLNPYQILEIEVSASRADIIKAVARAMQTRKYPLKDIAEAEKILLDVNRRVQADFINAGLQLPAVERPKRPDFAAEATGVAKPVFPQTSRFDTCNALLANIEELNGKDHP